MPELTADPVSSLCRPPLRATTLVVVALSLAVVGTVLLGSVTAAGAAEAPPPDQYSVVQGDRCVNVAPVTGSQSVEEFYDYRNPYPSITGNPEAGTYSAHGMREYQENQVSTLFVYRGPDGDSLVSVTGELGADAPGGSTTTFTFENLPSTGGWAVQDDEYPDRDDTWEVGPTTTTVTWRWAENRTDGGAYTGLHRSTRPVTIDARFNEEAPAWGEWDESGSPDHRITNWRVVDGSGGTVDLNMTRPVYLSRGSCTGRPAPSLQANATTVARNQSVGFRAGESTAGASGSVLEYRWDFDGDGTVDRVTESPRATYRYASAGTYDASVSVLATDGRSEPVSRTVRVAQTDEAAISVDGIDDATAVAGEPSPVRVSVVNDGGGGGTDVVELVADGEVVGTQEVSVAALSERTVTVDATFPSAGEYVVSAGSADARVEVEEANPELSVDEVGVGDDRVAVDEAVTVTAEVENVGNAGDEFDVRLELFDEVVSSKSVEVPAGETRTVEFTVAVSEPGNYTARVGDESAEFVVDADVTPEPPGDDGPEGSAIPGFSALAAALAVVALLAVILRDGDDP